VIASSTISISKAVGDGALYADSLDVHAFAPHVLTLEIPNKLERLIAFGLAYIRSYQRGEVGEAYCFLMILRKA
jgi:hypothetical protein